MKTFGETARELVFGSRLRKTRVLLAIAGSVVLAACPEEDLTFGEEPSVDIPIVDTTPPTFTLLDFPNILSEGIKNLRIRVTDQQGASGVDRNSFMITSCSSGVTATISGDEVISFGFDYDVVLSAPAVTVDTPYSCTMSAQDNASNPAEDSFTGVILAPVVADTDPPAVAITSSTSFNSDTSGTVTVEVTDASPWELTVGSCSEGASAQINGSNTTSPVEVDIDVPAVGVDTNFSCPLEATDSEGNTTTASIDGTIVAPAPQPLEQVTFWGECLAVQSTSTCDFFGGGRHFCEVSEPAATCNYNPLVELPSGTTPQFLILEDTNRFPATVDFSGWPQISESCTGFATERLTSAPNAPDTMLFECEAGSPGALVPPSVSGGATIISSKDGTDDFIYSVDVDAEGNVVLTANLSAPAGFAFDPEGDVIRFAGGGEESDTVEVFVENANGEALTIIDAGGVQGLETQLFVSDQYGQLWTFIYVHSDQDNNDATNPLVQGIIHAQNVDQGTPTNGGFILPLVSPELADFIVDNNLVISEDIVISARNGTGFAAMFDGAAGGPGGPGAPPPGTPGAPPAVGGGVAITIPPERLIERQACPIYEAPAGPTRCTAGTDETLLVVNGRSEIARYSPINGAFEGFYRDDTASVFPATDGWEATQGPDNCVLYTDNSGAVLLYDAQGELITGDGNGDASGTDPELLLASNNGALNYRGFDFYKLPNSDTWYLYIIEMTSFQESGFTNPRARIVRYDYSLSGDAVLSNRTVVYTSDYEHFIDLVVIGDQVHLTSSDEFIPFGQGEVFGAGEARRLQIHSDGGLSELSFYAFDSEFTGQITPSFDDGILVADFGVEQFRLFDGDDPSNLQAVRQTYNLMDQGVQPGTGEIVGIYPLRNGDYLVSGESPEIDRAVVARVPKTWELVPDGRSNEGRLIGRACLPE
ncbi:hypothetical protein [Ponticaulis sp.]|uniref:hypothetical protein n=1 Tax=Ponticaulis sp. TaxID=2020902 RepID=UPI000C3A47F8|nr:hypothetical protein [Ponticaulis sp.]MBN04035.1 hypothetical protein [Ponticaulis sp.]